MVSLGSEHVVGLPVAQQPPHRFKCVITFRSYFHKKMPNSTSTAGGLSLHQSLPPRALAALANTPSGGGSVLRLLVHQGDFFLCQPV
jgi:hypothetical protein